LDDDLDFLDDDDDDDYDDFGGEDDFYWFHLYLARRTLPAVRSFVMHKRFKIPLGIFFRPSLSSRF
jgi:hypothetical protein